LEYSCADPNISMNKNVSCTTVNSVCVDGVCGFLSWFTGALLQMLIKTIDGKLLKQLFISVTYIAWIFGIKS
jgi:hypothetical protein